MTTKPALTLALLSAAAAAPAEEPARLEPVIVTAALRPAPAGERPGVISVLGADPIREAAVVHL